MTYFPPNAPAIRKRDRSVTFRAPAGILDRLDAYRADRANYNYTPSRSSAILDLLYAALPPRPQAKKKRKPPA